MARYNQVNATAPALLSVNPYQLGSLLEATTPTSITSATLTPPGGSTGGVLTYSNDNDGSGAFSTDSKFSSQASMNAAYLNGAYTIAGSGTGGSFSASLTLSGSFSSNVPTITNSSWAGGYLVISPTAATTLTWTALSDATSSDGILLFISSHSTGQQAFTTLLPATSVSTVLPTLAPGTYDVEFFLFQRFWHFKFHLWRNRLCWLRESNGIHHQLAACMAGRHRSGKRLGIKQLVWHI